MSWTWDSGDVTFDSRCATFDGKVDYDCINCIERLVDPDFNDSGSWFIKATSGSAVISGGKLVMTAFIGNVSELVTSAEAGAECTSIVVLDTINTSPATPDVYMQYGGFQFWDTKEGNGVGAVTSSFTTLNTGQLIIQAIDATTAEFDLVSICTTQAVVIPRSGGSGGGGTGRKYKKAYRESLPKNVRIGRLEDVTLPNPRVLIDEAMDDIIEDVITEAKKDKQVKIKRSLLFELVANTKRELKRKKELDKLRRKLKLLYIQQASKRRRKIARAAALEIVEQAVQEALRQEIADEILKAKKREEEDLKAILIILAQVA